MSTREEIGKRIREAREGIGMSQGTLGQRLSRKRTHVAISELERGKVRLDAEDVLELATILQKDLGYFYSSEVASSIVYRRGDRELDTADQLKTNQSIEAFQQFARNRMASKSKLREE